MRRGEGEQSPLDPPEPLSVMEALARTVKRERGPIDKDEQLIRSLMEWPDYQRLLARLSLDLQVAVENAFAAAKEGKPEVAAAWSSYAGCAKKWLAWMTRYVASNRGASGAPTEPPA